MTGQTGFNLYFQKLLDNENREREPENHDDQRNGHSQYQTRSREDVWSEYVHFTQMVSPDLLDSKEACLENEEEESSDSFSYKGLHLNPENCYDLAFVMEQKWTALSAEAFKGTRSQFQCAVGQFARFFVAHKACPVDTLCHPGKLFEVCREHVGVRLFCARYGKRVAASTFHAKTSHLASLCDFAERYFRERGNERNSLKALQSANILRSSSSLAHKLGRVEAQKSQDREIRALQGKLFTPEDFSFFRKRAVTTMEGIIQKCSSIIARKGKTYCRSFLRRRERLLKKWNINFIAMLILTGGGQRPQVYAKLKVPTRFELNQLKSQETPFVELRLGFEKRPRGCRLPHVLFQSCIVRYLTFHVLSVRPFFVSDSMESGLPLLVHTDTGSKLSSSQITDTLRAFLCNVDPELKKVTTMCIRASHATAMMDKFRQKGAEYGMTREQFVSILAELMNTSPEQITKVYEASYRLTLHELAMKVASLQEQ